MPDRDEVRIRRATNLYDLLDDGVANNSDIRELIEREDAIAADPPAPAPQRIPPESRAALAPGNGDRKARNRFGIFLGTASFMMGSEAAFHPMAAWVLHTRMKRLPSFFEFVSVERARGYGICVAIFGILLLVYSLIKMPVADKKSRY